MRNARLVKKPVGPAKTLLGFKKVPVPQVLDGTMNALPIQLGAVPVLASPLVTIYDAASNKIVLVLEHFYSFETSYSEGIFCFQLDLQTTRPLTQAYNRV